MQHFFIKQNQINDNEIKITGKDVNHIKNVLRCKVSELTRDFCFGNRRKIFSRNIRVE